jgi:3-oxoacyl-[acyl-carrier protein] reductase
LRSDFDGLNVVVTGSGSGIGLELCQQLNSFGARVFGLDLSAGELGDSGTWISCDVGSTASVKKAFEEVFSLVSVIDIVANNAGISAVGSVEHKL